MNKKIIDAIKGGLWGLIVGDALGVPVEFQDREELEKSCNRYEIRWYT